MSDGLMLADHLCRCGTGLDPMCPGAHGAPASNEMTPVINLTTFMLWIELQPLSTVIGMLEIIGNTLYRHGRFNEGNEVKHVVSELREQP